MKYVIGNFKMNLKYDEIMEYINYFKEKKYSNAMFAPSNIYLEAFQKSGLTIVSQDVSCFNDGAYTGDVSASQLKSMGINYSIIGHSERRKYYRDDELVNEKMKRLMENDITPILCIGESKEERELGKEKEVTSKEIDDAFLNIDKSFLKNIIIAYEPIWSIGTGLIPNNNQIYEIISHIKKYTNEKYGFIPCVLYGGSVNNKCIEELEKIDNVDGYLVGGCSLKYLEFEKLINSVK